MKTKLAKKAAPKAGAKAEKTYVMRVCLPDTPVPGKVYVCSGDSLIVDSYGTRIYDEVFEESCTIRFDYMEVEP